MLKTFIGSGLLLLVVIGVVSAIGTTKYRMMTAPRPPAPEHPEIVVFDKPKLVSIRNSTTTVGTILAPRSLQLRTEVVGTVSKLSFTSGQVVDDGQLLVELDSSVEEAQLAGAQAAMEIAESTLKRTKQAANLRAISELELEQASAIMSQAKADVTRLKAIIRKVKV